MRERQSARAAEHPEALNRPARHELDGIKPYAAVGIGVCRS
jgi:hypothetical protein